MSKPEIIIAVCEIIDLLHAAQPGQGTVEARRAARAEACNRLENMPKNWWKRVPSELVEQFTALA